MEQTKKSTYKLLFYLKKNEPKKNGNVPIMARITIDGTLKTMGTKLEIDPNIWGLKFGRVEGKSAKALSVNQKMDNIRGRIDKIYEDMLKHEGFATAQKVKIKFLGAGVMEDAILKVFREQNLFELWLPLFPFGLFPIFLFGATPPRSLVLQRYPPGQNRHRHRMFRTCSILLPLPQNQAYY